MGRLAVVAVVMTVVCVAAHAQDATLVWKVGTQAPKGVGWSKQVEKIAIPVVDEATKNALEFKFFWGGIMGTDPEHVDKIRSGELDGAGLTAEGAYYACPEMSVVGAPFLFRDYDEVDYLRKSMFDTFNSLFEKHGFVIFMWADQDFDQVYSTTYGFETIGDFERARFVCWLGSMEDRILSGFGADPVCVNVSEIPRVVDAGEADSMVAPAIWMVGAQMYRTVRFVNPMKLRYSPALVLVGLKSWNSLDQTYRDNLRAARVKMGDEFRAACRRDNKRLLAAMIAYGVAPVKTTPKNLEVMVERGEKVADDLAGVLYPQSLLDQVRETLAEYRAKGD